MKPLTIKLIYPFLFLLGHIDEVNYLNQEYLHTESLRL